MNYKCTNAFREGGKIYRYDDVIDGEVYGKISSANKQWFIALPPSIEQGEDVRDVEGLACASWDNYEYKEGGAGKLYSSVYKAGYNAATIKLVKCESGRYIAYYKERNDIIANGEDEKEAVENLEKMYKSVIDYESKENK